MGPTDRHCRRAFNDGNAVLGGVIKVNRRMESEWFYIQENGLSSDRRANRWIVVCKKCKRKQEPPPTRLAKQYVQCHCGQDEVINWNDFIGPA